MECLDALEYFPADGICSSNAKSRKAFKLLLHKLVLYDFEETSESSNSQAADETSRGPGHRVSESHDTPDVEVNVNKMDRSFGGKLRRRYWAKLTNPPETVLERTGKNCAN